MVSKLLLILGGVSPTQEGGCRTCQGIIGNNNSWLCWAEALCQAVQKYERTLELVCLKIMSSTFCGFRNNNFLSCISRYWIKLTVMPCALLIPSLNQSVKDTGSNVECILLCFLIKSYFMKKYIKNDKSCVRCWRFNKREIKENFKRMLDLYIKKSMHINANGLENLVAMDDFLGNFKLAILSQEEIENHNRRIIKREIRTLPKKLFFSQSSRIIGFMGKLF